MDNNEAKEFGKLQESIAMNKEAIDKIEDSLEKIQKILNGNGNIGLVGRIVEIEKIVQDHLCTYEEEKKTRSGFFRWALEIFIAAAAAVAAILQIKNS